MSNINVTDVDSKGLKVQKWGVLPQEDTWIAKTIFQIFKVLDTLNVRDKKRSLQLWGDQERPHGEDGFGAEPKRWVELIHMEMEERYIR